MAGAKSSAKAKMGESALREAGILADALPYMQHYAGRIIVVKLGGQALSEEKNAASFAKDIALLQQIGVQPVIVHGGGPQVSEWCRKLGIEPVFHEGRRQTGPAEAEIAEMVLSGTLNKHIVRQIHRAGAQACGISGSDGALFTASALDTPAHGAAPLNLTGKIEKVHPHLVQILLKEGFVPVIAPLAPGKAGEVYNINADDAAGALAGALNAARLMLLTDIAGILDEKGQLLSHLDPAALRALMASGQIDGGMRPKAQTSIAALEAGVEAAVILDGRQPHALLRELFTPHGAGSLIEKTGGGA